MLGPGAEFDLIRGIWQRLGGALQSAGDDCAIVQIGSERLAFSTDLSSEGVHFRLGWMTHGEIGWRAAAAALSDLAAVAASPAGILVSLAVPDHWPAEQVSELMQGAGAVAQSVGAVVWGGDLTRNGQVVVDVAVVGRIEGRELLRSGAQPGDALWVTGTLGGPGAALSAWFLGQEPDTSARQRFVHPVPRVEEAKWLRDHGARALIDLSDGLAADVSHIAAASRVRCTIQAELVPVHPAAGSAPAALASGEEYELLCAMPAEFNGAAEFASRFGLELTRVGSIEPGEGVEILQNGTAIQISGVFRHF